MLESGDRKRPRYTELRHSWKGTRPPTLVVAKKAKHSKPAKGEVKQTPQVRRVCGNFHVLLDCDC